MATTTTPKSRHWASVIYPESAPKDWLDLLDGLHIKALVSPLHDKDVKDDGSGELKKPHYHVLLSCDGPVTYDVAKSTFDVFGGVGAEQVRSLTGYARYLCHMDNADKTRYSENDVIQLGGADFAEAVQTNVDRLDAIEQMQQWCDDNNVFSMAELNRYARANRRDWFRVLNTSAIVPMDSYVKSLKWEHDSGGQR